MELSKLLDLPRQVFYFFTQNLLHVFLISDLFLVRRDVLLEFASLAVGFLLEFLELYNPLALFHDLPLVLLNVLVDFAVLDAFPSALPDAFFSGNLDFGVDGRLEDFLVLVRL